MSPVRLYPVGRSTSCSVRTNGTITFPQFALDRAGWTSGESIAVSYLTEPCVLLFWKAANQATGFKLSGLNRSGSRTNGGKITCTRLANHILRPRVALPKRQLTPIFPENGDYQVGLVLDDLDWQSCDFSAAGVETLEPDVIGTYELLNSSGDVVYVGEGILSQRIRAHLNRQDVVTTVRTFRWLCVDKEDAVILERLRLAAHEGEHGALPTFNKIRA